MSERPTLSDPNETELRINITVKGNCPKVHGSFEEWQQCEACERVTRKHLSWRGGTR